MRRLTIGGLIGCLLLATAAVQAEVRTRAIEYKHGDTVLEGYIAWDDERNMPMPGVLIIHDWNGLDEYEMRRARELAELGYFAFAIDFYGKGVRPKNPQESAAEAGKYRKDYQLLRSRLQAALQTLREQPQVDKDHIGAMGYCFGGAAALELARSGADVKAVVSFHGNLNTSAPAETGNFRARVLVLHGADDPGVPDAQVQAFMKEMRDVGADWQLVAYGNAVHSFTNPAAGDDPSRGNAYNALADARSWAAMRLFFEETLRVAPAGLGASP
jgi:dienelactone hydrolase